MLVLVVNTFLLQFFKLLGDGLYSFFFFNILWLFFLCYFCNLCSTVLGGELKAMCCLESWLFQGGEYVNAIPNGLTCIEPSRVK